MSSGEISDSRSFSDFYLDESLTGHLFLRPSIFVAHTYTWIFSPAEERGCDFVITVVARAIVFCILPIIALLAALLVPVGLISKGLSALCCPPTLKNQPSHKTSSTVIYRRENSTDPSPPLQNNDSSKPIPPSKIDDTLESILIHSKKEEEERRDAALINLIQKANDDLDTAQDILDTVNFIKIDINKLNSVRDIFSNENITQLRSLSSPSLITSKELVTEFDIRFEVVRGRLESFQHQYDFYSKVLNKGGEIDVANNGDCLFLSFIEHSGIEGSAEVNEEAIAKERKETVEYILSNYGEDPELQTHLINSLCEHYYSEHEKLNADMDGCNKIINETPADATEVEKEMVLQAVERLPHIRCEMEILESNILPMLNQAFGDAGDNALNFPAIECFVPGYLEIMLEKGVYGGAAELYALSCRHKVCVKIHRKTDEKIAKRPYKIMNPQFESAERPARHFTHTRNHYNPYFPKVKAHTLKVKV